MSAVVEAGEDESTRQCGSRRSLQTASARYTSCYHAPNVTKRTGLSHRFDTTRETRENVCFDPQTPKMTRCKNVSL